MGLLSDNYPIMGLTKELLRETIPQLRKWKVSKNRVKTYFWNSTWYLSSKAC